MEKKITKVITYGTFDLFHEGHYRLLQRAKALGDYLIVGVTTETYDKARGKLCVVDSLLTRIENVKKTGFVDEIVVEEIQGQKFNDIKKYDIDIFTVGSDWTGSFDYLKDYCEVVYLPRTEGISTTKVAYEIAQELGVYMPITTAIYKSIYEGADIKESILNMMSNELRSENEWDKK